MSTFDDQGRIDPSRGVIVTCVGKKGSGKSVMALSLFQSYPGDRIVLDIAGDDGPVGDDVIELRGTVDDLPRTYPDHWRDGDRPMTMRYVPDPGSRTILADLDHVVGLARRGPANPPRGARPGECCLLVHEMGRLCPVNRTPPNTSRALEHGRHEGATTQIYCGPRSQGIDPLVLQQADLLYVFELQSKADRQRIAENIGWNPREFDELVEELRRYEKLVYDANVPKPDEGEEDLRLVIHDPLPLETVRKVDRWAKGFRHRRKDEIRL